MVLRHVLIVGALAAAGACGSAGSSAPVVTPPAPPSPVVVHINDPTFPKQCTDIFSQELNRAGLNDEYAECLVRFQRGDSGGQLREWARTLTPYTPPPEPLFVFAPLRTDGPIFLAGDQSWRWRGVSAFKLAALFQRGQIDDVDQFLAAFKGYNVLRVFDYTSAVDGWGAEAWDSTPPDVWIAFLDHVGRQGFRVELTLLTDDNAARIAPAIRLVEALKAARPPNLFLEAANEPHVHKSIDTAVLRATLETSGFPYSSGDFEDSRLFYGTYGTFHSARDSEWPRRAHDALDYFNGGGPNFPEEPANRVPWICDEPGKYQDVGAEPNDWRAYFAACSILAGGATLHFEGGKFGRLPNDLERSLASIALDAMTIFPADAPKGPYSRPVEDSLRTYTVGPYTVRVRPTTPTGPFGRMLDANGILWTSGGF